MALITPKETMPPSKKTLADGGGVLILGLPRSGTYSVAHALKILGHEHVFHNLDVPWDANEVWGSWIRPMWAYSPYLREHVGLPYFARNNPPPTVFTTADWDDLVGRDHQAVADMTVYFAAELIETYPNAQVILWERDIDRWYHSYMGMLEAFEFHSPISMFIRKYIAPFSGIYWHTTMWYGVAGWLRAKDMDGMRANAKDRYREHFEIVRKMVKPGNLLEYHLGNGWEPLCNFLNCPVPEEPFPHLNEKDDIKKLGRRMNTDVLKLAVWKIVKYPLLLGIGALVVNSSCKYLMDGETLFHPMF
ncbi:putative Sulfotransferase domain-containing protein [Seiridium cardinale]|uniref:Sulfotransferase domain-containing protein n=1 Tax=Seiridium cardinale TaxID=138064 RepID=A0ABR2Y565_9PEZI